MTESEGEHNGIVTMLLSLVLVFTDSSEKSSGVVGSFISLGMELGFTAVTGPCLLEIFADGAAGEFPSNLD